MNTEDSKPFDQIAKLELYEHPETGAELVAAYTEDGEEYVITSKKLVKRLIKYVEDDIDIHFVGTVAEDPYLQIQILDVDSYEPLQEIHELKPLESPEDLRRGNAEKRRRRREEEEDFDNEDLEHGYHQDLDFEDSMEEEDNQELDDLLKGTDFDELDDSMFEDELMEEDLSEDEKQRLQSELDAFVSKEGQD